jgi:hypothetical protein
VDKSIVNIVIDGYLFSSNLSKEDQILVKSLINLALSNITIKIEPPEYSEDLLKNLGTIFTQLKEIKF